MARPRIVLVLAFGAVGRNPRGVDRQDARSIEWVQARGKDGPSQTKRADARVSLARQQGER
jgi:hypothetical protein